MSETPTTSNLNTGSTLRSFTEMMDVVKHMDEVQKEVSKGISILASEVRRLHVLLKSNIREREKTSLQKISQTECR